jgi:hypothetical protein
MKSPHSKRYYRRTYAAIGWIFLVSIYLSRGGMETGRTTKRSNFRMTKSVSCMFAFFPNNKFIMSWLVSELPTAKETIYLRRSLRADGTATKCFPEKDAFVL